MFEIHYQHEVAPEYDWIVPAEAARCEEAVLQEIIDDWVFEQDSRWFPTLAATPAIDLEHLFHEHSERWARETAHLSSPTQIMMNPNYQAVMGIAAGYKKEIIRLMLLDLRDKRRLWFWALNFLTQENPVSHLQAGKLDAMIGAWVKWGTEKGII